jgi:hypothetical protein
MWKGTQEAELEVNHFGTAVLMLGGEGHEGAVDAV